MKKELIFLTLALLVFPMISAVDVELDSVYGQGETLIAKVSGNFVDQPTTNNIAFYRGHVKVPMVFDLEKIGDDFYIYALLLDKTEGEYSLRIKDVRYYKATEITDEEIIQNFNISDKIFPFSVTPGFLVTSEDFSVNLKNSQDSKILISIETSSRISSLDSVELKTGEEKNINFEILNQEASEEITFNFENSSFTFQLFNSSKVSIQEVEEEGEIELRPKNLEVSMATDSQGKRILYLNNIGETNIEKILLEVSEILDSYVTLSIYEVENLRANSSEKIEISIISDLEEAIVEGLIFATSENVTISSTLVLNFEKDFIPTIEGSDEENPLGNTCSEVGGEICDEDFECEGESSHTVDGLCCFESCSEIDSGGSRGKLFGWSLIIIILILVFLFWKFKYKKVGK
jgi:hypothetical protein